MEAVSSARDRYSILVLRLALLKCSQYLDVPPRTGMPPRPLFATGELQQLPAVTGAAMGWKVSRRAAFYTTEKPD